MSTERNTCFWQCRAPYDVNREAARYQIPLEMIHDGSFLDSSIAPVPLERFSGEPYIMLKPDNDTRKRAVKILTGHNSTPDIRFELDQQLTSLQHHLFRNGHILHQRYSD